MENLPNLKYNEIIELNWMKREGSILD